jgi:hypothetical protein
MMRKTPLLLILSISLFIILMWALVLTLGMVPAHSRDPFGAQSVELE